MPHNGAINPVRLDRLKTAALDAAPVSGLTHNFYRYPARFSPTFAATAIELFSKPGQVVLDPYMGGGTTIVEALVAGRRAVGNDLNQLSEFIVRVKTRPLGGPQVADVRSWVARAVPQMHFRFDRAQLEHLLDDTKTFNLSLPAARPLKKALAGAMLAIDDIKTPEARAFARCVLLRLGQWALDGRKRVPTLGEARDRLAGLVEEMLGGLTEFDRVITGHPRSLVTPKVFARDAAALKDEPFFKDGANHADLVVTSPPYPGVHLLYHRWQINGRREAPAPYWLSETNDGHGAAFYNFADRRPQGIDAYFEVSLRTLRSIRCVVKKRAVVVQMIAFSDPDVHLPLYLANMQTAGFREATVSRSTTDRIWRDVPGRKWHAAMKGQTHSSREVVLIHEAV
jgi:hypothetical protein